MLLSLLAAWHIFAATALDANMSPEEKRQTGVDQLDDGQRAALQQWIDARYTKKTETNPSQQPPGPQNPTLSENLRSGRFIRLSDGTLWSVRPADVPIVQGWITPAELLVSKSDDPFFSNKITNKLTSSSILVRKIDQLPPATEDEEEH